MPLTQTEAAEALRDISQTEQRSSTAYGYRLAAPHLILWGAIWFIGYGAPSAGIESAYLFPVLSTLGVIGSFCIGSRYRVEDRKKGAWRYWATVLAVFAYVVSLFAILPPGNSLQIGAFFPLLAALFYAIVGIWARAPRMLITGAVIATLTLVSFFFLKPYFGAVMAIVGGGRLLLGGFWLRSV